MSSKTLVLVSEIVIGVPLLTLSIFLFTFFYIIALFLEVLRVLGRFLWESLNS